jgi:sugar lactone lactonase YvrE
VKANSSPAEPEETAPGYRKNHRENLQMYSGGFAAFFGDYPGVSPSRPFEYNNSGWRWASDASTSLTAFTDNRDAEFPLGVNGLPDIRGDWTAYTPLVPTNPADKPAECAHVAMRNANPYFTEIGGLVAGAPQTFKRLTIQRAFATYVENRTPQDRFFRLTIQDNEAAGIDGSFDQFLSGNGADALDVKVFANSSQHRTVWVQPLPGNPTASLQILVREITDIGGALVGNGLRSRVVLNPDPNNDAPTTIPPLAPPYAGNGNITADNSEIHDPQISSPQIATFRVGAPQISSPQISSPQIATLGVPQISSNSTAAPQISSPQIATPGPDAGDENGTDVTYVVTNEGTTNTNYDAIFNVPNVVELMQDGHYQFQVIVSKTSRQPGHFKQPGGGCEPATKAEEQVITSIPVPQIATPQIATIQNPQIASPQIATPQIATFSLGPAGGAEGQNSHGDEGNEDSHSTQLPESVNLTLRAIRLKAGGPNFDPTTVQVRVKSLSTNVVLGVVGADGTQPSAFGQPDLLVINYTAASPALSAAAGDDVVLSSWTLKNQGGGFTLIEGAVHIGIYLSDDPIITASDTLLSTDSVGSMTAGQEIDFSAPTVEIPAETEPGDYYIGILVDRFDTIEESNEDNNYVSEPITITSGVACLAPPSGMISWWPGDGTGDDIKDANTAFDWGGIDYAAGKVGPAFTFNGDGQYLAVEGDASLRPTTLTVDFWFKSDEDLDGDITIRPFVVNLDDGDTITFFSKGYDFFYRLGALHFRLRSSLGSGIEVTHTVDIAAGGWHHVAGTFDGDMQRLYLDGVQVGTAVDWSSLDASLEYIPADILLGKVTIGSDVVSDFFFDGQIDEIELFDRALSSDEIADLYAADSDGKCKLESLNLLVVDGDSDLEATVIKRFEEDGTPLGKMSRLSPFGCIQDLAVKDGDVYAADTCNERIVRISPDGTQTDFFVDTNPDLFFSPEALAFDAGPGNLFVADSYNDMIYRITPAGVRTEFLDLDEDDPDRIDIKTFENDLIVAYDEFIYPSDTFGTILRVDPTGVNVDAVISDGAFGVAGLEVAADAGFYVVADDVNHRLIKINAESGALTVFSSDELFCCDMSGMARDDDGNLIMAVSDDEGVFRLISVSPTAVITLLHEGDPLLFPRRVAIYRP